LRLGTAGLLAVELAALFGRAIQHRGQLIPGTERKAEQQRHGLLADGELFDLVRHMPDAMAASREKRHVAGTEPPDVTVLIGDENLAPHDVQEFIDVIMPMKAPRRACPDVGRGGAIGRGRQALGSHLRGALDDPVRGNRNGDKFSFVGSGNNDRMWHGDLPALHPPLNPVPPNKA
jgi:hypothetical protein